MTNAYTKMHLKWRQKNGFHFVQAAIYSPYYLGLLTCHCGNCINVCLSAIEVTLNDLDDIVRHQTTTKRSEFGTVSILMESNCMPLQGE